MLHPQRGEQAGITIYQMLSVIDLGFLGGIYFMRFLMLPYMYPSHQIMQLESERHDAGKGGPHGGRQYKGMNLTHLELQNKYLSMGTMCGEERFKENMYADTDTKYDKKIFSERWILIHLKAGIILWCTLKSQVPSSYLILSNWRISLKIFFILYSGTITVQVRSICSNTKSLFPLKTFCPAHG